MIPVWVELVCDCCAEVTAGSFTIGNIPRRKMKRIAKREGWRFTGGYMFCGDCVRLNKVDEWLEDFAQ